MAQETEHPQHDSGELPAAHPVRLHELVGYVPGSVVSHTLVKNAAGTITLFAFDAGQGLSEHSAPYDAVVQILDGVASLSIGGKPVSAAAGETVLMPANVPHAVQASQRFKMVLTMIRG
jgi:quercetin dioxygenase-like cupin family protein